MMERIIKFGAARGIELWQHTSPNSKGICTLRVLDGAGRSMSNATLMDTDLDQLAAEWCKQRGIGVGHVKVEVRGGVAEFTEVTEGINVEKTDWDCLESGECPHCGYALGLNDEDRCPECGGDLEE